MNLGAINVINLSHFYRILWFIAFSHLSIIAFYDLSNFLHLSIIAVYDLLHFSHLSIIAKTIYRTCLPAIPIVMQSRVYEILAIQILLLIRAVWFYAVLFAVWCQLWIHIDCICDSAVLQQESATINLSCLCYPIFLKLCELQKTENFLALVRFIFKKNCMQQILRLEKKTGALACAKKNYGKNKSTG